MLEDGMDRPFHLAKPPVTRVRLGLFFEPEELVGLSAASEFITQARPNFPTVSERLPFLGWMEDSKPADIIVKTGTVPSFPLVSMTSASGHRELSFQNDRFVLAWTFDESGEDYPGYEVLSQQLRATFDEFSAALVSVGAPPLQIRQAQCFYLNTVRDLPGTALATYMLTGEERVSARDLLEERTYVGARVRQTLDTPEHESVHALLQGGVDAESDDAAILWLRVTVENPDDEPIDSLDLAHALLIENFIKLTPDWLREEWNKV